MSHVCGLVSQINARLDAAWVVFSVPLVKWVSLTAYISEIFEQAQKFSAELRSGGTERDDDAEENDYPMS